MLRLSLLTLFLTMTLLGCRSVPIDVSHASTDKGFLNSGLRDLGELYVLNSDTGALTELATIDLQQRSRGDVFSQNFARNVRGVEIGGNVDVGAKAGFAADIAQNSFIRLTNAFDESYTNTFRDLSIEINTREAAGEDLGFTWFLDQASETGSPLRYLLVYSTIRADEAIVGYGNSIAANGELSVPVQGRGDVDIEVSGLSQEEFRGSGIPVLVNYHVIQVFKRDGLYKFRIDLAFDSEDLPALLRGRTTLVDVAETEL